MNYKIPLSTPLPILPKDLPRVKIDYKGLLTYAKSKGLKVIELTDEEKGKFIFELK